MKLTKQEENRILELLQRDPEAGLRLAMDHFGGTVKWIAATILGQEARQDVEECVAETFVRLWRNSGKFRSGAEAGGSALYSYICGIARHVAVDMVRRRPKGEVAEEEVGELADDPDFAEQLVKKENQRILWETVDQLPPPDREIFLMRYWLELRVKEIAQRLGLTEKQVENRLYRGRQALRRALEERGIIG